MLPLALTVQVAREVLAEAGFDPNLVALAAERPGEGIAKTLATRPEIRIIDYTGSTAFGDWLEANARQAQVYTEKAGVNTVIVESTDDYKGMLANLAFSLSLYSGQMCTTPQNLLIPRDGIRTDEGPKSFDEVTADLARAVDGLLGDDARANALLGAIVNPDVKARLEAAAGLGEVALASREITNPEFPDAVVRTPVIVKLDGAKPDDEAAYIERVLRPGLLRRRRRLGRRTRWSCCGARVREKGAMTVGAYTTDPEVERADRGGLPGGGRPAVPQPHGRGVRQPDGRLLRLPRLRRQPGGQRGPVRRRVRREPLPRGGGPPGGLGHAQCAPGEAPVVERHGHAGRQVVAGDLGAHRQRHQLVGARAQFGATARCARSRRRARRRPGSSSPRMSSPSGSSAKSGPAAARPRPAAPRPSRSAGPPRRAPPSGARGRGCRW